MTKPRVITETIVREWQAVGAPVDCRCGHQHYPRVSDNFAPQWGFCEADCGCNALRPSDAKPPADRPDGSGAGGASEGEGGK